MDNIYTSNASMTSKSVTTHRCSIPLDPEGYDVTDYGSLNIDGTVSHYIIYFDLDYPVLFTKTGNTFYCYVLHLDPDIGVEEKNTYTISADCSSYKVLKIDSSKFLIVYSKNSTGDFVAEVREYDSVNFSIGSALATYTFADSVFGSYVEDLIQLDSSYYVVVGYQDGSTTTDLEFQLLYYDGSSSLTNPNGESVSLGPDTYYITSAKDITHTKFIVALYHENNTRISFLNLYRDPNNNSIYYYLQNGIIDNINYYDINYAPLRYLLEDGDYRYYAFHWISDTSEYGNGRASLAIIGVQFVQPNTSTTWLRVFANDYVSDRGTASYESITDYYNTFSDIIPTSPYDIFTILPDDANGILYNYHLIWDKRSDYHDDTLTFWNESSVGFFQIGDYPGQAIQILNSSPLIISWWDADSSKINIKTISLNG